MATQRHDGDKNRNDNSDKNSLGDRTIRKGMSNHKKGASQNKGGSLFGSHYNQDYSILVLYWRPSACANYQNTTIIRTNPKP